MSADAGTAPELLQLADRLAAGAGPLLLVAPDLQIPAGALEELTDDPRPSTRALVSRVAEGDRRTPGAGLHPSAVVRRRGGLVVSAGSSAHSVTSADGHFVGAVQVADADRAAAADAARDAADAAARHGWDADPLDVLLVALVRGGIPVSAVATDPWPWRRGGADDGTALADLSTDDVHRIRLTRATKADDGLVATFLSRPIARRLTPLALRAGLTPNTVTTASLVIGLAAAACFATGERWLLVLGAVLLQLSLIVDCVDGDIARYTRRFSATGAWLDASTDRLKEFACYGGLAWGADGTAPWLLAAAMLTLQTARHSVDYTFTAVKDDRESESGQLPLDHEADTAVTDASVDRRAARAVEASERSNRRVAVRWVKKALHLGIGERWLVLSVLAAAGLPAAALGVLLVLGLVSLGYTSAGRVLRTRSWPATEPSPRERGIVLAQADLGPLVRPGAEARFASGRSRYLWVRPAALRLVEFLALLAVVVAVTDDGLPAAYALLLVVASHHYDDLYRVLNRIAAPPPAVAALGLGAPGRLVVVTALAVLGDDLLEGGLWVLAAALGILYLVVEPARVLGEVRRAGAGVPEPEAAGG